MQLLGMLMEVHGKAQLRSELCTSLAENPELPTAACSELLQQADKLQLECRQLAYAIADLLWAGPTQPSLPVEKS